MKHTPSTGPVWLQAMGQACSRAWRRTTGLVGGTPAHGADVGATPAHRSNAGSHASSNAGSTASADLAEHAAQLAELQAQMRTDPVTGLLLRQPFIVKLQRRLAASTHKGSALLLLRVPQLDSLNTRLGHEATEHVQGAIGHLLLTYVDRVAGAQAGRLNSSDFALWLPAAGVAAETALSLRSTLCALSALRSAAVDVTVGGVDALPHISGSAALAEADAALARAEAGEGAGLVVDQHADLAVAAAGAGAWRSQIEAALLNGHLQLQTQAVCDRQGQRLHAVCQPQLQLGEDETLHPARLCLALARRSQLLPQLECATLHAALKAIASDTQARRLRFSAPSLAWPGLIEDVAAALRLRPAQAAQLSIVMPWHAHTAAAIAAWRPTGVHLGVDLDDAHDLGALAQQGVEALIADGQLLRGVAQDASAAAYAGRLCSLARELGLQLLVDGEVHSSDLAVAWDLGLGGITSGVSAGAAEARTEAALSD